MQSELISLREAARRGVSKLRLKRWANPRDHIRLHLVTLESANWTGPSSTGKVLTYGPWVEIHSEMNSAMGLRDPQKILITQFNVDAKEWLACAD